MALNWRVNGYKHLGVRPGTVLDQELTDEGGWSTGAARTPSSPDLATPELSQIDVFFETDAQKEHLDTILAEWEAGE